MKILALDFSSRERSIAVVDATSKTPGVVAEIVETGAGAMKTFAMIESALRTAGLEREQIECLAVGLGPGSYTGIRAALSIAQGWQLALGVKLLGVSSAEAVAARAHADGCNGSVSVIIDAQRNELYVAGYEITREGWRETVPLRLATVSEAAVRREAGDKLIGPEVTRWFADGTIVCPRASVLGRLASGRTDFAQGDQLTPIYLREISFVKAPPPRVIA